MGERYGYGPGGRWAGSSDPETTGSRHALDPDAAATPIFSMLRRQAARPAPAPLRPDPPTTVFPAVPPVDRPHPVPARTPEAFAPPSPPSPPSASETTTSWRAPLGFPAVDQVVDDAPPYVPAPSDHAPYGPVSQDRAAYEPTSYGPASYDSAPYDPTSYDSVPYEPAPYDPAPHEARSFAPRHGGSGSAPSHLWRFDHAPYGPPPLESVPSGPGWPGPRSYGHDSAYDAVGDTGRHHRRLAPAGW